MRPESVSPPGEFATLYRSTIGKTSFMKISFPPDGATKVMATMVQRFPSFGRRIAGERTPIRSPP
jgi:hypothetical protein